MPTQSIGSRPFLLIRSRHPPVLPVVLFAFGLAALWITGSAIAWQTSVPRLVEQVVDANFGIGYAVTVADINRDGKMDIVAINATQAVWFENPTWKKYVIMDGLTKKDNVCVAVHDIDGDGRLDLALGAPTMPASGGTYSPSLPNPRSIASVGATSMAMGARN